ncbi:MAG: hypothetical protein ACR2HN_07145 [Tepidiformaceae bacterium]
MILRGTIVSFNSVTWRAVIRLDGSTPQTLTDVRVSRYAAADIAAPRRCLVDTGDHGDIADAVLTAVWTA